MSIESPKIVCEETYGNNPSVLEQNIHNVLLLTKTRLNGAESEVHQEDQKGCDKNPNVIDQELSVEVGLLPNVIVKGRITFFANSGQFFLRGITGFFIANSVRDG